MLKHGVGTPYHPGPRNSKVCLWKNDAGTVLGFNGPILEHYQDYGQTVNSAQYCSMLEEEFNPAIHSKHRGMLTVVLFDFIW